MSSQLKILDNDNAVISWESGTFKLSELSSPLNNLTKAIATELVEKLREYRTGLELTEEICSVGLSAELLEPGSAHWIKGKIRIKFVIDFIREVTDQPQPTQVYYDPKCEPESSIKFGLKPKILDNDNAVIALETGTFKLAELYVFLKNLTKNLGSQLIEKLSEYRKVIKLTEEVFTVGLPAEILEPGAFNWIKGKVRIKLVVEFTPDNESTL